MQERSDKSHITVRITANLTTETMKGRKAWNDVLQAPKENNF
jgi:hypothetical protein